MFDVFKLSRLSLGIIFLWYGVLKFFPDLSPAEELATKTIDILFYSSISSDISIKLLALWEVVIGLCFLFGIFLRLALTLFFVHMTLTFSPLFILPEYCFTNAPFAFTLVGQYIVKNIVFILMGVIIYKKEISQKIA